MIHRDDIVAAVEQELDDLLATAPENLSEAGLKAIREESIAHSEHVLGSLSFTELQSPLALKRFIETTVAQARMRMHMV
jgi:hypothetical protein